MARRAEVNGDARRHLDGVGHVLGQSLAPARRVQNIGFPPASL